MLRNKKVNRVLIIEDCEDIRSLLMEVLSAQGYTCIAAAEGSEGLRILLEDGIIETVSLIMVDVSMSGMGGLDFIKFASSHPIVKNIPIVIHTRYINNEVIEIKNKYDNVKEILEKDGDCMRIEQAVIDQIGVGSKTPKYNFRKIIPNKSEDTNTEISLLDMSKEDLKDFRETLFVRKEGA